MTETLNFLKNHKLQNKRLQWLLLMTVFELRIKDPSKEELKADEKQIFEEVQSIIFEFSHELIQLKKFDFAIFVLLFLPHSKSKANAINWILALIADDDDQLIDLKTHLKIDFNHIRASKIGTFLAHENHKEGYLTRAFI